jgi:hypothetical protein
MVRWSRDLQFLAIRVGKKKKITSLYIKGKAKGGNRLAASASDSRSYGPLLALGREENEGFEVTFLD